ncbi:MAG: HI0074 family nucleotidyltransferase substrate-binding subunit [Lachnospiraceae bacterium]|nr:HI0074 family nucleotidyltransferase substrate-binding subunit [Lachnospiraceae bacterium]
MKKYENYVSNLHILKQAYNESLDNEFIISGIINKFSIQFELGWKMIKELLSYEGSSVASAGSPRSIIKEAYAVYSFFDGDIWLQMLKDRNDTAHIYDGDAAKKLTNRILEEYIPQFVKLEMEIRKNYGDTLETI